MGCRSAPAHFSRHPRTRAALPRAPHCQHLHRTVEELTDLRRNASWWPWILIAIFSLLFIYAIGKQVGLEQISKNQIAHSSRADQFDKLSADQQTKQIQISSKIIGFFAWGSPILILFYALIETLALWLTFSWR